MALNVSTFKTRTLTAAVFVVVMLAGLLWNYWSFFILFSIIHFGCWIEYFRLVSKIDTGYTNIGLIHRLAAMLCGWCFMLFFTSLRYPKEFGIDDSYFVVAAIALFMIFVCSVLFKKPMLGKNIAHSIMGLTYISLPLGLMISLRNFGTGDFLGSFLDYGWIVPMVLIGSIWINDTMAYIVGSFIGKTPFSKISPKKTWEGTIGGALLAILVVSIVMMLVFPNDDFWPWTIVAVLASVMGTLGDLFESKLKRLAGVKDSGHIMPGHGGFLDRFDSLLFAIPFVWLFTVLMH
ncbi:MAG TPA: phosphatidate cytidylyltransferase [Chitinophagaceae bacterium]|nr:phosphatidate cytidylyltransferase [Chitinophagaceae bacterium]